MVGCTIGWHTCGRAYHMAMWYKCMFLAIWTIWYAFFDHVVCVFQNHRKLQFRIINGQKCLKPWHKTKTKFVWCMWFYYTSVFYPEVLLWDSMGESIRAIIILELP